MNKTIAVIAAMLASAASFAAEYHWRGNAPDMTTNGKSGNWADASNWTDASGNAVADYPLVAGDVAVFHGMAQGGYVQIVDADVISVDEIRFAEGNTLVICSHLATVNASKLIIDNDAVFELATTNPKAHWESDIFSIPNFTVGNRSELVISESDPQIRNAVSHWYPPTSGEAQYDARGALTIDANGKLTPMRNNYSDHLHETGIGAEGKVWGEQFGCVYGCCGNYRGFYFNDANATFTVNSGIFIAGSPYAYMGRQDSPAQGTVSANGGPMCLWGYATYSVASETSVRAKINASAVTFASNSRVALYDDHSADTVSYYRVVAGVLSLGGTFSVSGDGSATTTKTCTMGTGTIEIGWNASLDVACENALNAASTISVKSYNGKKGDFGTVNLAYGGTVNKLIVDGVEMAAGTYGATGSGAANIRDDIFTGTGVLTVTAGEGGDEPPVVVTKPFVIYFE